MSTSFARGQAVPWWKEPTKDQWLAWWAAWLGWTLDAFDFTIFLLIMVPIANEFNSPLTKSMDAPFEQQRNPTGRRCDSFVRRGAQARFDVASHGTTGILSTGC